MAELNLKGMIGEKIRALVPFLGENEVMTFKLHNLEQAGIWVESQALTDKMLSIVGAASAPRTLVVFLPWSQIQLIFGYVDEVSLSQKALGL